MDLLPRQYRIREDVDHSVVNVAMGVRQFPNVSSNRRSEEPSTGKLDAH